MLLDEFEFVKGFPKTSASRTDFWKIKRKTDSKLYSLKLFVDTVDGITHPYEYALLKHEVRTYKLLKKHLIDGSNVRNILPVYAIGIITFEDIVKLILKSPYNSLSKLQIAQNIVQNTKYMLRKTTKRIVVDVSPEISLTPGPGPIDIHNISYAYMVTPYLDGPDFVQFLKSQDNVWSVQQLCKYASIIATTLYQMMSIGVNENDLHFSNILMSKKVFGPTKYHSKVYLLVFNNKAFIVDNQYTPFVYDFDRAAIYGKYITQLERVEMGGNCPTFHNKRDFVRFLCGLYKWSSHLRTNDHKNMIQFKNYILHNLIIDERLRDAIQYSDPSCWMTDRKSSVQCNNSLLQHGMVEPDAILKYIFKLAKFETVSSTKLYENHRETLKNVSHQLYYRNRWNSDIYKHVYANVQFIGKFDKSTKLQILNNIIQKCSEFV